MKPAQTRFVLSDTFRALAIFLIVIISFTISAQTNNVDTSTPTVPPPSPSGFTVTASQFSPVSGAVTLTASGYSTANIVGVQFVIDGLTPAGVALPPYYGYPLNAEITTGLSGGSVQTTWAASIEKNGSHRLAAVARYADGSQVVSPDLTLTVSNPDFYNRQLYVDKSIGSDTNDGLAPTVGGGHGPWRSPVNAIGQAVAGDTIYLKGTFNGGEAAGDVLDVRTLAGTAALPIRITATDPLNMPTFSVGITGSGKTLYNDYPSPGTTRFLVIDHIHFDGTNSASFDPRIELSGMDHVALRTITVDGAATNSPKGLRFRGVGCTDNIIDGGTFTTTAITQNNGDGISLNYGCQRNRIINNTVGDFGHAGIVVGYTGYGGEFQAPSDPAYYNVIAYNTVTNRYARGVSTNQVGDYTLIEYNTIRKSMAASEITWPVNSKDLLGLNASHGIIRFNQLYGSRGNTAILLASYNYNFNQVASYNEIYHNVVYDNSGQAFSFSDKDGLHSQYNKIYNNVFFRNAGVSPNNPAGLSPQTNTYHFNNTVDWVTGTYGYNEVRNNIFLRDTGKAGEITITKERNSHAGGYWDIRSTISQIQSDPNLSQYWSGNLELDPQFVNAECRDFHLQPGSPAIQAGKIIAGYPYTGTAPDIGAFQSGDPPPPPSPGDTIPPAISIIAPANGATISGTMITVSASASGNVCVMGMQFKLDGANLGAEVIAEPYAALWDTFAANGAHTLTAEARDAAGHVITSSVVSVTVANPTISILAPLDGATLTDLTQVTVQAESGLGLRSIGIYCNGILIGTVSCPGNSCSHTMNWYTNDLETGYYFLYALATDTSGYSVVSTPIFVFK